MTLKKRKKKTSVGPKVSFHPFQDHWSLGDNEFTHNYGWTWLIALSLIAPPPQYSISGGEVSVQKQCTIWGSMHSLQCLLGMPAVQFPHAFKLNRAVSLVPCNVYVACSFCRYYVNVCIMGREGAHAKPWPISCLFRILQWAIINT